MKGGQWSHNHLVFKCTAGAGIKQQRKCDKKNKTRNYDMEEGGRELWKIRAVGARTVALTQGKKGLKKKGCQVKLGNKDNKEKWKSYE